MPAVQLAMNWSNDIDLSDLNTDQQVQATIGTAFDIVFTGLTVVDVSTWTFSALIAPDVDSGPAKAWVDASFNTKTSGGLFTLSAIVADTSTLAGRNYYIQIRRTDSGHSEIISKGFITLSPNPSFTPVPPATGTVAWGRITDTPTTSAGYGITDAGGDALRSQNLDQFADVTQVAGKTFAITNNASIAGVNTGDQTNISGNAATVSVADAGSDTTCFVLLATAATGSLTPATNASATFNAATGVMSLLTAAPGTNTTQVATCAFVIANSSGGTWGSITGTLSSQTDLQAALDAKAGLATKNSFTKQQNFGSVALTSSSAHIAWNLDNAQVAKHVATENTTLDNPTNMVDGGTYIFKFVQHASAAKTLTFGNAYRWAGGFAPSVSTGLGAVDIFTFVSDGTHMDGVIQKAFS